MTRPECGEAFCLSWSAELCDRTFRTEEDWEVSQPRAEDLFAADVGFYASPLGPSGQP